MILFVQAQEYLSRSLENSPQTVTYKDLGRLHLRKGNLHKAIETYTKAVKLDYTD